MPMADRKYNKNCAERGVKVDSRPGPRTKVIAIYKDISEKKVKVARHFDQIMHGAIQHEIACEIRLMTNNLPHFPFISVPMLHSTTATCSIVLLQPAP